MQGSKRLFCCCTRCGHPGCLYNQPVTKSRGEAFKQYETIIRWSQWDAAADFISLDYQAEHPITRLEMDRLRLFRVTQYNLRSANVFDEGVPPHRRSKSRCSTATRAWNEPSSTSRNGDGMKIASAGYCTAACRILPSATEYAQKPKTLNPPSTASTWPVM